MRGGAETWAVSCNPVCISGTLSETHWRYLLEASPELQVHAVVRQFLHAFFWPSMLQRQGGAYSGVYKSDAL